MSLLDYPDGVHLNVPAATYHERTMGLVSSSSISQLGPRTPAHYHRWVTASEPDEETPALTFGRAWHCATLEPEVFGKSYAVQPDFGDCRANPKTGTTKEEGAKNKAARDAWRMQHAGREFLAHDDYQTIVGMAATVRSHPLASKMLHGGVAEATVLWTDPETQLRCRVRPDYWVKQRGLVVDIKSTMDASEYGFTKSVFQYGYHRQHALYRTGLAAIGAPARHFVFVVVEKFPPYAVATYTLDEEAVAIALDELRSSMRLLRDCMQLNMWPGYPVAIRQLKTPQWKSKKEAA